MLRSAHASFFFGERLSAGLSCNHAGSEESERQEPDRWTGGARWRKESQPCESNSDIITTGRCLSLTYMSDVCVRVDGGTGERPRRQSRAVRQGRTIVWLVHQ